MCNMYFSQYNLPFLFFAFGLLSHVFAHPHSSCTQNFINEIQKMNITQHCHMKQRLGAEFGWNFNNNTRRLHIAFGARLDTTPGWLAWGLNLHDVGMVGTQALIGIKHVNESLSFNKYNITEATKRGCQLVPSDDIGLDVQNFSFDYVDAIRYYVLQATIFLPYAYDSSRTNIVCQIGKAVLDEKPHKHPSNLAHLDTGEAMDLVNNQPVDYLSHQRKTLRLAHGIINIAGWGTLLPIGLIVARYFREFPFKWQYEVFRNWQLWYACHVLLQTTGYAAGLIGWALGLWIGYGTRHYSFTTHRILGITIVTIATMQVLAFIVKPSKPDENQEEDPKTQKLREPSKPDENQEEDPKTQKLREPSKPDENQEEDPKTQKLREENRKYWNMYHHGLGYSLLVLIWVNIFLGIMIMESDFVLKWAYIGVVGVLGCVVVALECVTWFKHNAEYTKLREAEKARKSKGKNNNDDQKSQDHIKKAETSEREPHPVVEA